jgi:hypothetical protein
MCVSSVLSAHGQNTHTCNLWPFALFYGLFFWFCNRQRILGLEFCPFHYITLKLHKLLRQHPSRSREKNTNLLVNDRKKWAAVSLGIKLVINLSGKSRPQVFFFLCIFFFFKTHQHFEKNNQMQLVTKTSSIVFLDLFFQLSTFINHRRMHFYLNNHISSVYQWRWKIIKIAINTVCCDVSGDVC